MNELATVTGNDLAHEAMARRIEESGLNNMHTRRQLLYDGWLLFLSPGKAKRGRSVSAQFSSTRPLDEKIEHCEKVYARHGLPMLFRVTPFSHPAGLDAALAMRGYVAFDTTLVQLLALDRPPQLARVVEVELSSPLPEGFVEDVGAMRGSSATQRAAHLERLAQTPLEVKSLIARRDGEVIGAGMLSVDGDVAGVFDMVTASHAQGQGIGTAIVTALLTWAWEHGVRHAFLQVTGDNRPALAVYGKLGFTSVYTYHYRGKPGFCR